MENMKIKAVNAPAFIRHLEVIRELSGIDMPYPFDIWEQLVKLEKKATRMSVKDCNTGSDSNFEPIKKKVLKLLPNLAPEDFYLNLDPRGYALKIEDKKARELNMWSDWGGYGIIAPEF